MINNLIIKSKNISFDIVLFYILLAFITIKIFLFSDHYIEHDELVNLTTYYYKETIFLKNYPNNHFYISLMGFMSDFFMGTNLILLKFINYISFILILFLTNHLFKEKIFLYLCFFIYLFSDLLFVYSFVLRGYYITALFFCLIFYLLTITEVEKNQKFSSLALISTICAFQIANNISSVYLVGPIIMTIILHHNILNLTQRILIVIYSFIIPLFFLSLLQVVATGLYMEGFKYSEDVVLKFIYSNFTNIILSGINRIYFNEYVTISLFSNLEQLFFQIKKDYTIFIIFFIAIFIAIFRIIKKKYNFFDLIILYFFVTFLFMNRFPPERIYISFFYFFLFYVFSVIKMKKINKILNRSVILTLITYIVLFSKTNIYANLPTLKNQQIEFESNLKCNLEYNNLKEIEKHLIYFLYLQECNKKRNLNDFMNFYMSR